MYDRLTDVAAAETAYQNEVVGRVAKNPVDVVSQQAGIRIGPKGQNRPSIALARNRAPNYAEDGQ